MEKEHRLGLHLHNNVHRNRGYAKLGGQIEAGDGSLLNLQQDDWITYDKMTIYIQRPPPFRYIPAVAPTYGTNNGHWYLECKHYDDEHFD